MEFKQANMGDLLQAALETLNIEIRALRSTYQSHSQLHPDDSQSEAATRRVEKASVRLERAIRALTAVFKEHREYQRLEMERQKSLSTPELIRQLLGNPAARQIVERELRGATESSTGVGGSSEKTPVDAGKNKRLIPHTLQNQNSTFSVSSLSEVLGEQPKPAARPGMTIRKKADKESGQ